MIEVFEWISTGGCEECDALWGFHSFEPDRPHIKCRCEVETTELDMATVLDFIDDILDFADEDELEDALDQLDDDLALTAALGPDHGIPRVRRIDLGDNPRKDDCPIDIEVLAVDVSHIAPPHGDFEAVLSAEVRLTCTGNECEHDFTLEMRLPQFDRSIPDFDFDAEGAAKEEVERRMGFGDPWDPTPDGFCSQSFQPEDPEERDPEDEGW